MSKFRPYSSPIKRLLGQLGTLGDTILDSYYKYNLFDDHDDFIWIEPNIDKEEGSGIGDFQSYGISSQFTIFNTFLKDITDTFKPYKSSFYIWRDALQPFIGLGAILRGIGYWTLAPLFFIYDLCQSYNLGDRNVPVFMIHIKLCVKRFLLSLYDGFNDMYFGASKIITTPLTWFLRMPLRAVLTAIEGWKTFEQLQCKKALKLENLVLKEDKTVIETLAIDDQFEDIHRKMLKAEKRGLCFSDKYALKETLFTTKFTQQGQKIKPIHYKYKSIIWMTTFECYPQDTKEKREAALNFLSLFRKKVSTSATINTMTTSFEVKN